VTPCTDLQIEDGSSKILRNVSILPHHYTVSQHIRWRQHGDPKRWYPTTTLQSVITRKMKVAGSSKMLVSYRSTPGRHNPLDGGSRVILNVGILPQHSRASQHRTDHDLNLHRRKKLESRILYTFINL